MTKRHHRDTRKTPDSYLIPGTPFEQQSGTPFERQRQLRPWLFPEERTATQPKVIHTDAKASMARPDDHASDLLLYGTSDHASDLLRFSSSNMAKQEKTHIFSVKAAEIVKMVDNYSQNYIDLNVLASQASALKAEITRIDTTFLRLLRKEKKAAGFKVTAKDGGLVITSGNARASEFQSSFEEAKNRYQRNLGDLPDPSYLRSEGITHETDKIEEYVARHVALVEYLAEEKYKTREVRGRVISRPNPEQWKKSLKKMLESNADDLAKALVSDLGQGYM